MNNEILLYVCVGGAVSAVAFLVSRVAVGDKDAKLLQRLSNQDKPAPGIEKTPTTGMKPMLQKIGTAAAQPFMPKDREKQSSMRRDLGYAGVYYPSAPKLLAGCRFICMVVGLILGYVSGVMLDNVFLYLSLGGLVGYFIPRLWLRLRIGKNQKMLTLGLPDALDLMVVCVEAGLTIDSAMQRVGQELVLAHPAVSRELGIAHMETRVGLSRAESLKNLGVRTGNASFQSLAAMLIQADRFGTSVANALRIHADSMRVKRQHAAEEMAAKASVKMSFPLVLFIFPATFIVLAGPTVIGLMNSALFNE
jgi:tight adherence protein C